MPGYYETGRTETKVCVIADQFVAHSAMTAFTANESGQDFRNYDFIALMLLRLRGDYALSNLLEKTAYNNTLYKITDMDAFKSARNQTYLLLFGLLPTLIAFLALAMYFKRRRENP